MRIAVGSDHAGLDLKQEIMEVLRQADCPFDDLGTWSAASVDYPDVAAEVSRAVAAGTYDQGILICGTGIGMSIAANKVSGVRAALCHDTFSARMAREHNDANVLCMGARVVGPGPAGEVARAWLGAGFAGGRHQRRVDKLRALDGGAGQDASSAAPAAAEARED